MKVAVSYLSSKNIIDDLRKLSVTDADYIHVDVMDGKFVRNRTLGFNEMKEIHRYTNKRLDVHLMVNKPMKFIHDYATLNTEYITIHIENKYVDKCLDIIDEYGIKTGLAIKPDTVLEKLIPYLKRVDQILLMSVNPGLGGQEFIDESENRLKELKKLLKENNSHAIISVDGGINDETKDKVKEADMLVSGSYILSCADYQEAIDTLRK